VGTDSQESFTESDEAGNVQDLIWRELMQLHTVNKKQPTKKFMDKKRNTM
jgi:hypothetical protein